MEQNMKFQKNLVLGVSALKSINYTLQSLWMPVVQKVMNGNTESDISRYKDHLKLAAPKIQKLLENDAENILNGIYPKGVLLDEKIVFDWLRLPKIIADSIRAHNQRKLKKNSEFDKEAESFSKSFPEYYKRNFHYQKSGYLSDESADLYEQQVEILFSGTAQVMRRQILKPLKTHFKGSDGEGLKFLEVGSGTSSLTRSLTLAFPKAQITCLDLSPHYLKKARADFKDAKNISFMQGMAEDLQFKDEQFDVVLSCYLFHELPLNIRAQVLNEKWRVLKKGGFLGVVDSIQKNDDNDLQFAIDQFPVDFHEPFYKNYVNHNLARLIKTTMGRNSKSEIHFLTKAVFTTKIESTEK